MFLNYSYLYGQSSLGVDMYAKQRYRFGCFTVKITQSSGFPYLDATRDALDAIFYRFLHQDFRFWSQNKHFEFRSFYTRHLQVA